MSPEMQSGGLSLHNELRILTSHNIRNAQMDKQVRQKLPIRWVYPDNLTTHFSDNVMIQFSPPNEDAEHFILSFFQLKDPLIAEQDPAQMAERLKSITHIDAKCVSRIILTPQKLRALIKALGESLERFENIVKAQK